jgi:hypothetical protein
MQKIELQNRMDLEIFCPFCGTKVLSDEGPFACEHVLYHASDFGISYVREDVTLDPEYDVNENDTNIDEYTDTLEFDNAIKLAIYNPPPSMTGGYIGFSVRVQGKD